MTPNEYRKKHKRCRYCIHATWTECKVKDIKFPITKGRFCKVYKAKEYKENGG